MSLRLYIDVQVPAAITSGLRRRGVDVLTSQEDGTRQASDQLIFERATMLGRILVSQDTDMLDIASDWQKTGWEFSGLIFARQDQAAIGQYVEDLQLIVECCDAAELTSAVWFLPLA